MDTDDQGISAPSAALLMIIGEPFSEDHKTLILAEITKGFRCWDVEDTGININEELAQIANAASLGEEGINGERIIQHQSDNLAVEILVNPLSQTVKNAFKKLLVSPSSVKYVIHSGHVFQDTGAWVLQDDTFTFSNLAQVFRNSDVENALKQNIEASLTIHTLADSHWGASISKADFTNSLRIQLNPAEKLDNIHGVLQFTAYIGIFLKVVPITSLLQGSEQFGNISFTRPTLYIFPGCQGDSALFGTNGFNLLVNGGYNRRACFWDFARHLDRIDAMLLTHLGSDNIFAINSVLERKNLENIHPQIGYLYFNALEKLRQSPVSGEGDAVPSKSPSLLINLSEEASRLTLMAKHLGITPHPCSQPASAKVAEPINLYHKLGHGSLDMYILNPVTDSKEMKEFFQLWGKQAVNFGKSGPFSLQNVLSVCTLLVWKPYNLNENIVRIFFPGNAPQHKVIEGLEKVKTLGFLKQATCTGKDLVKPPAGKKTAGSTRPSSGTTARGATRPATRETKTATSLSPRKPAESRSARGEPKALATSPTKTSRTLKEDVEKKNLRTKDKSKPEEKENETKGRTSAKPGSASQTKPSTPSARKTPSPTKAAPPSKSPSPPKYASPAKTSPAKTPVDAKPASGAAPDIPAPVPISAAAETTTLADIPSSLSQMEQLESKPESDQVGPAQPDQVEALQALETPQAVPEPSPQNDQAHNDVLSSVDNTMTGSISSSVDRQKLEDLGIYDDPSNQFDGLSPIQSNGSEHTETEEEEVKPQALPEPPEIIETPVQDLEPVIPDYTGKIQSDEKELDEFSKAEEEMQQLDKVAPDSAAPNSFADPAQEIPPSPEPNLDEQQDFHFQPSTEAGQTAEDLETPTFSNEENVENEAPQLSMEHNIQYGIDDSSKAHAMGGIQEEDEEAEEEEKGRESLPLEEVESKLSCEIASEELNLAAGFDEMETDHNAEVAIKKEEEAVEEKQETEAKETGDEEEEEEVRSDCRLSAERQFEDVEEEGLPAAEAKNDATGQDEDEKSSLPPAFDRDSSPEIDAHSQDGREEQDVNQKVTGLVETQDTEDRDSLDGGTPDSDKDIDESFPPVVNGKSEKSPELELNGDRMPENHGDFSPPQQKQAPVPFEVDSDDELQGQGQGQDQGEFDPIAQWGPPMGLPSPPPPDPKKSSSSPQKSKTADKRPASSTTARSGAANLNESRSARTARNGTASETSGRRPATAPARSSRPGTATKRPGSRTSPPAAKLPPLPPMTPFYMDLTYIPNHGDPDYSDVEFFKRVRARYYVLSAMSPNPKVLDSLVEAKATWEQKDLEVTLIPTYENEMLRHWVGLNKDKLQELKIELTPAVSRCTIQLQDLETSLPAYRLEV